MSIVHFFVPATGLGTVTMNDRTITQVGVSVSIAAVNFLQDGAMSAGGITSPGFDPEEWLEPKDRNVAERYEIRATLQAGSGPGAGSDPLDTWLVFDQDRTWNVTRTGIGSSAGTFLFEIREAVTQTVVGSATDTLNAQVTSE